MKKILTILGSLSLIVTPTITVIACGEVNNDEPASVKLQLNSIITKTDLATFKVQPTNEQVMYQTKALNPNLDVSQVQITSNINNQATITVNTNSTVYEQGSITITYKVDIFVVLKRIWSVVNVTDLGQFIDPPTDEQILVRAKELNPNLDTTQVQITENDDNGNAKMSVVHNSPVYIEIDLNLTYVILDTLEEVIKNIDLGGFETQPTNEQILARVKELNPNLDISQLQVLANADGQAIVDVIPGSKVYEPSWISLTYVILPLLSVAISTTDLGVFETQPTDQELLDRLKFSNPALDISQIKVTENANNKAIVDVIVGSKVYSQSSRNLTYLTHTDLILLKNVIKITTIGRFYSKPSGDEILERTREFNWDLNTKELYVTAIGSGLATITVKPDSKVYVPGSITITYIDNFIDLASDITVTELGEFSTQPTNQEILDRTKKLNPNLYDGHVYVLSNVNNKARISAQSNSAIYRQGTVDVTYTVNKIDLTSISEVIKITNLNTISSVSPAIILEQVKELNQSLIVSEVEVVNIENDHASIRVKENSVVYAPGSILVTFIINVLPDITRDLTNSNLGNIGSISGDPDLQIILDRVGQSNPKLVMSEVHLVEETLTATNVSIAVNIGSRIYSSSTNVTLSFVFTKLVDFVVTNTDLGKFNGIPTAIEILNTLNIMNRSSNLIVSQLEVTANNDGKATVSVIPNSYIYKPNSVEVTYQVVHLRSVIEDLRTDNLGIFNTVPTDEQLVARIKELNPNLIIEDVTLRNFPDLWNAILTTNLDSTIYIPRVQMRLIYRVIPLINLEEQLTTTNLGHFDKIPTSQEILERIQVLNLQVDISQLQVTANVDGQATVGVIPNSPVYISGSIKVNYIVRRSAFLDIDTLNLGVFHTEPTDEETFNRLKELNPKLIDSEFDFERSPLLGLVRLRVNDGSLIYREQEIVFFYAVKILYELAKDLTVTDLGTFEETATIEQVIAKIKELNPKLDITQITLTKVTESQATITVNNHSSVYLPGEITVTFKIHRLIALSDVVKITDLGNFNFVPLLDEIIDRIVEFNPTLIKSEVYFTWTTLSQGILSVKTDSKVYIQGTLIITFKIAVTIWDYIPDKDLGWFENTPTAKMILERMDKIWTVIDIKQVIVSNISNMKATITVKKDSEFYAQGSFEVTFTHPINLSQDLRITSIGGILFATVDAILTQLKDSNPNINTDELTVTDIRSILLVGSATINVKPNSKYYYPGSIDISFAIIKL